MIELFGLKVNEKSNVDWFVLLLIIFIVLSYGGLIVL